MTLIQFKNNKGVDRFPRVPSVFSDFFSDFMNDELANKNVFKSVPSVNISENPSAYIVELAVPGMQKNEFKIEVENNTISISGEKKAESKDENSRFTRKEFSYTSFTRTFTMPDHVASDAISAEYVNGILKLTLPKKEEAKAKPVREVVVS